MKKLLLIFLIGICGFAWRSEEIVTMLGFAATPPSMTPQYQPVSAEKPPAGMSIAEFAELAKTDPDAYQKLFASHQQHAERSAIDKLMNFLARGKYE